LRIAQAILAVTVVRRLGIGSLFQRGKGKVLGIPAIVVGSLTVLMLGGLMILGLALEA